ncbi:hypothetical protein HYR99_27240 [Candidatus Poribacteria bacterium]|nr:hypothetical protein [Candidatus Poribacteria bacterium]
MMEQLVSDKAHSGETERIQALLERLQKSKEKVKVGFASDIGAAIRFIQEIDEVKELIQRRQPAAMLLAREFETDWPQSLEVPIRL